jgi:hydrogenase nickel incorporation protein HypA/HybF
MHEMTITMNILEIVEEHAKVLKAKVVHEIEIDIGELSGIDFDALEFAMENAQKTKLLENSRLLINRIPARARCKSCGNEFDISNFYTACPECNEFIHEILQGKEIKVRAISID